MKTVLVLAATFGLSASAALADCTYSKVMASAEIDRDIKTASITKAPVPSEQASLKKDTPSESATTIE